MTKRILALSIICTFFLGLSACSKQNDGPETAMGTDMSGNYIEAEINLPESIYTVTSMYAASADMIRVAGYDQYEQNSGIWEYNGKEWSQILKLSEVLKNNNISPDSEKYSISISEFDEILVLSKSDMETKLFILDKNYNITSNLFIDEVLTEHSISSVKQIDINLYLLTDGMGKLFILDTEKETIEALNSENEFTFAQKFVDGYLYILTTEGMRIIDCATLDEADDSEIKKFFNDALNETDGFKINIDVSSNKQGINHYYLASGNGITQVTSEEQILMVDGSRTALGNDNYLIDNLMVFDDTILVLMSEENKSTLYTYEYTDKAVEIEDELEIYTLEDNQNLNQAVNLFRQQNPSVKVNVTIGMSDDSITISDALKKLNIELETGNGADIIILDGMPVDSYIEKGILLDISDIIQEIENEDVVLNDIVNTYESDLGTYAVPLSFYPMYVSSTNEKILKNSQNIQALIQEIIGLKDGNDKNIIDEWSFNQVVSVLYRCMLASEEDGITEDMIKNFYDAVQDLASLTDLKKVTKESGRTLVDIDNSPIGYGDYEMTATNSIQAALDYISSLADLQIIESISDSNYSSYSFIGESGDYYYVPSLISGISAKSHNQNLSKNFIAFLLGEEAQSNYDAEGLPVNINGIKKKISKLPVGNYAVTPAAEHENSSHNQVSSKNIKLCDFTDQDIEELLEEMSCFKIASNEDSYIRNIILAEADNIVFNGAGVESAVVNAMNNINIYKNE